MIDYRLCRRTGGKKKKQENTCYSIKVCKHCGKVLARVPAGFKMGYVFPFCSEECEDAVLGTGEWASAVEQGQEAMDAFLKKAVI